MTTDQENNPAKHDESDVYDRQIRLWGAESQTKMSQAKVLYIHVTGLSAEILKNLVLAGIRAVLCDPRPYPDAVVASPNFLLPCADRNFTYGQSNPKKQKYLTVAEAMQPVVEELNPLLGSCEISPTSVDELSDKYVSQFSIVIASQLPKTDARRIAKATTNAGGKFFLADTFGMMGACALDLGSKHIYRPEIGKTLLDPTPLRRYISLDEMLDCPLDHATNRFHKTPPPAWVQYRCLLEYGDKNKSWPSELSAEVFFEQTRSWIKETAPSLLENELLSETSLRALAKVATSEVAPVCSVLGGIIGNEVIKAISGKGEPANNAVLFDGTTCKAWGFLVDPL